MRPAATWLRRFAAVTAVVVVCGAQVLAQTPPPWTISVAGEPLTLRDIGYAMVLMFGGNIPSVQKQPAEMPQFAQYAWYAGRDKDGKPIVWVAAPTANGQPSSAEAHRELEAVSILYGLDMGRGGPTLQRLYHALPADAKARNAFAGEIIDAVSAASAWTVKKFDADRKWIFANVQAGLPRQRVYALLDERGLAATNDNESLPKPSHGPAYVTLNGEFQPGCSFTHRITITFDANDRVKKLDLNPPHPNCV